MRLKIALLAVMTRWQITGYKLGQASGLDRSVISKLIRGEVKTAEWEKIEQLLNGFEKIDPMARDAFMGALQRPDSTYPLITDATLGFTLARESPELIAEILAILKDLKLVDLAREERLKAVLAEEDPVTDIPPCTLEEHISKKMIIARCDKDGI
ncbi:hypothetical protein [Chlorogloea sp. CCALA 695]|uniref:hypothetical protein n=1 Tax=Chlorogloea sp. CCALA 695 TaxID=2107693 RepID=UPI000D068443|nr:hypothetical protein [Chlorogloea sp. CCALA 695]PSB32261.1 hypothetical protein C7B70_10880 [Chlorogloea sp. CCALA 695]